MRQSQEVIPAKSGLFQARSSSFGGWWGSSRQITFLGQSDNSRLVKITFLGEAETTGIKSWFGGMGLLAQVTPFTWPVSFFNNTVRNQAFNKGSF